MTPPSRRLRHALLLFTSILGLVLLGPVAPAGATYRLTRTRKIWEGSPIFSPDGTKIVYERRKRNFTFDQGDLWTMDTSGANRAKLFSSTGEIDPIAWPPI